MAKSFIDVRKEYLRTGLGIPVKTKKLLLSRLYSLRVVGSSLKSRTTLPSSIRPECDFYWPSLLPRSTRPPSSLVFITRVRMTS